MKRGRASGSIFLVIAALSGCATEAVPQTPAGSPTIEAMPRPAPLAVDAPAPAFHVDTVDGKTLDSKTLVGSRVLVIVFFTTWCRYCEREMPLVREAVELNADDVLLLAASMDGPETWDEVAPYVERHRLAGPLVRAAANVDFAMAYDARRSIPFVVVVGRNGQVVDLFSGYDPSHGDRLKGAITIARAMPVAPPPP